MIYMAHPDYLNFVSNVTNSGKYSQKLDCTSKEYCYSKDISCRKLEGELKDLVIKLDNTSYTVPAYGYLVEDFNGAQCAIAVSYLGILQDSYVLGDTFIKNFYATFNYQNMTVGLAQNSDGPTTYLPILVWYAWLGISIAGLVVIILIGVGVCYCRGRGKKGLKTNNDALLGESDNEIGEGDEIGASTTKV